MAQTQTLVLISFSHQPVKFLFVSLSQSGEAQESESAGANGRFGEWWEEDTRDHPRTRTWDGAAGGHGHSREVSQHASLTPLPGDNIRRRPPVKKNLTSFVFNRFTVSIKMNIINTKAWKEKNTETTTLKILLV